VRKNKNQLLKISREYINKKKRKAKIGDYSNYDDYETYKMIYALADLFPVDDKYFRDEPEVEQQLKELWYLYFFFKHSIDGKCIKYSNIVKKYC
tara:strand:- start:880 stop:1161 length:282 start_codon:yes stop_codon:yes gene_type:complete